MSARKHQPVELTLPRPLTKRVLCLGGRYEHAFCLAWGDQLVLSPTNGDLGEEANLKQHETVLREFLAKYQFQPELVVCDLDPVYATTQIASRISRTYGIPCVQVQHHQAHLLAPLVEDMIGNKRETLWPADDKRPLAGVILDGGGYGLDGQDWGGEVFTFHKNQIRRTGHLYPVSLPGDGYALTEPYRMMLSHIWETFGNVKVDTFFQSSVEKPAFKDVWTLIKRKNRNRQTTSAMRLIDATAALLLGKHVTAGQRDATRAMIALAQESTRPVKPLPFELESAGDGHWIDTRPLIGKLVERLSRDWDHADLALAVIKTVPRMMSDLVAQIKPALQTVVLGGELIDDDFFRGLMTEEFEKHGFRILTAQKVASGDANLALGQLGYVVGMGVA
jgi:hydrogenase maturation protein HypF